MKKILLLVSGLLIACMAGSAMALPAEMDIIGDPISFAPDGVSIGSATVHVYKIDYSSSSRCIFLETSDANLQARVILGTGSSAITSEWTSGAATMVISDYDPNDYKDANGDVDYVLQVRGKSGGEVTVEDKYTTAVSGTYDRATASPKAKIPEFPTLALPVASILGLIFIFGRKKEGL